MEDDGRGGAIREGAGLAGMRERVEEAGGTMTIETARGVTLTVRIPADPAASDIGTSVVTGGSGLIRVLVAEDQAMVLGALSAPLDLEHDLRRALDAGVRGYLLKDAPAEELARAVRTVQDGGRAISPELAAEAWYEADPLTDRERQVLRLAATGPRAPPSPRSWIYRRGRCGTTCPRRSASSVRRTG